MMCPDDTELFDLVEGRLGDDALGAMDAHLDRCALCREVVATLRSGTRAVSALDVATLPVGARVGRYTVQSVLGQGAMGTVYLARDEELRRDVALKLLHGPPQSAGQEGAPRADVAADAARMRERLIREARAMAQLAHPNVIAVYDVGEQDGQVYVAMERAAHGSLREWLEEPPLRRKPEDIVRTFVAAGRGLAAAHDAGLVHRDFKPENVMLAADGRAQVTDFGVAKAGEPLPFDASEAFETASDTDHAPPVALTRTGALLGTPAYMAPEQLRGEAADDKSDQFAFCVSLAEALHGRRPFRGKSVAELLADIESGGEWDATDGERPDAGAPERPSIDTILMRGLSAAPARRFPDMNALLAALEGSLAPQSGRSSAPAAASTSSIPARPERARSRTLVMLGAAAIGAGALWMLAPGEALDPCAALRRELGPSLPSPAPGDDGPMASLRAALSNHPQAVAGIEARVSGWARRWEAVSEEMCAPAAAFTAAPEEAVRCLDDQRQQLATVLTSLSDMGSPELAWAGAMRQLPAPARCRVRGTLAGRADGPRTRAALQIHQHALSLRVRSLSEPAAAAGEMEGLLQNASDLGSPELSIAMRLIAAEVYANDGRFDRSAEAARSALFAAQEARDERSAAEAWLALLRAQGEAGQYDDATETVAHAEAAVERAGSPHDLMRRWLRLRGVLLTNTGALDEARRDIERLLALLEEPGSMQEGQAQEGQEAPDPIEVAAVRTSLGNVLRLQGDLPAALAAHRTALRSNRAALGDAHPRVGRNLHNVAGVLRMMGRLDEARERYQEALTIKAAALGEHPDTALTRNSLGLVEYAAEDWPAARAHWLAALAIFEAHDHADRALVTYNLSRVALAQGDANEAQRLARQAIHIDRERFEEDHPRVLESRLLLARALLAAGDRPGSQREAATVYLSGERALADQALGLVAPGLVRAGRSRPSPRPARPRRPFAAGQRDVPSPSPTTQAPPADMASAQNATPTTDEDPPVPRAPPAGRSGGYGAGQPW